MVGTAGAPRVPGGGLSRCAGLYFFRGVLILVGYAVPLRRPWPSEAIPTLPPFPMRTTTRILTLALLIAPLTLVGCDAIESVAGLDNVNVPLGSAGDAIPVAPNAVVYQAGSVDIGQDIPGSPSVDDIMIAREDITFTPIAARGANGTAGTCALSATLLIDDMPAVSGTVDIVDDVVTAVSVGYASPDYDRTRLCEAIDAEVCPVSESLTEAQIRGAVESAINSGGFNAGVVVDNPGDCQGTLDIERVTFDFNL